MATPPEIDWYVPPTLTPSLLARPNIAAQTALTVEPVAFPRYILGLLPPALKAELASVSPNVAFGLTITGGSITRRYSDAGLTVPGTGLFEPRILQWGDINRAIQLEQYGLPIIEVTVDIADHDEDFTKLVEGANARSLDEATARIQIFSAVSAPYTLFDGKLRTYDPVAPFRWQLKLRTDDFKLDRKFPSRRITQFAFPQAHGTALGKFAPLIYGEWRSAGLKDETNEGGMVPTFYVKTDADPFRYLVMQGWANAIPSVYKSGLKLATSAYSISHPLVDGIRYTTIDFTTDQGDPTDNPITCDVEGFETVGDGTGTLIKHPVAQLKHALDNFVYGEYKDGPFLTSAPIDEFLFNLTSYFLTLEAAEGSIRVGGDDQIDLKQFLANWLTTWDAYSFWTNSGKLGLLIIDPTIEQLRDDNAWVRWERDEREMGIQYNFDDFADIITARYLFDAVKNTLTQTMQVRDLTLDLRVEETVDQPYLVSRLV